MTCNACSFRCIASGCECDCHEQDAIDDAIQRLRGGHGPGFNSAIDTVKDHIAELRAERDELREKVERYEREVRMLAERAAMAEAIVDTMPEELSTSSICVSRP